MEAIKKIIVPKDLEVVLPHDLYVYGHKIRNNLPLTLGIFKNWRNSKRLDERKEAWSVLRKQIQDRYVIDGRLSLSWRYGANGSSFFFFTVESN